ncbi:hypothetical protein [Leptospira ainlahdjerensis]|nr:hypothetical protein [Leptospira ainlahdjerensis]
MFQGKFQLLLEFNPSFEEVVGRVAKFSADARILMSMVNTIQWE